MGSTNLTNVYSKDAIDKAMIDLSIRKSAVWNSGLVTIDPELANFVASSEGRKISRIGYQDLADPLTTGNAVQATTHNPGYPDDSSTNLIPNASSKYSYDQVKTMTVHGLGQKEIIKAVSYLEDPVSALGHLVSGYWARFFDMYVTLMMKGIFLENLAGTGDMIVGDGTAAVSDDLIIDAFGTLGDAAEYGGVMIAHSKTVQVLRKAQMLDTIPSADNPNIFFTYFNNTRVLTSDQVPVYTNGTTDTCVSILAMPGVIEFGETQNAIIPSEIYRDPLIGVGGGEEILITRKHFAAHPTGYTWNDDTVTGAVASGNLDPQGSTDLWPCAADMALAANWTRKLARKKIKIAFMHTSEVGGGVTA